MEGSGTSRSPSLVLSFDAYTYQYISNERVLMNIALWIVQVVLAAMFIFAGVNKAFRYEHAYASLP